MTPIMIGVSEFAALGCDDVGKPKTDHYRVAARMGGVVCPIDVIKIPV